MSLRSCAIKLVGRGPSKPSGTSIRRILFLLDLPSKSSHFSLSSFTWASREFTVESSLNSLVQLSMHACSSSCMVWSWAFSRCSRGSTVFSSSCFTEVTSDRRSETNESILPHISPFMEASINSSRSQSGKLASSFGRETGSVEGEALARPPRDASVFGRVEVIVGSKVQKVY